MYFIKRRFRPDFSLNSYKGRKDKFKRERKMREKTIRFLPILLIFFLFTSSIYARDAVSKNQKNFLWKVQSKTGTVYMLGSIHLLKKESYPLHEKIENVFDKSSVLVVEAHINDIGP